MKRLFLAFAVASTCALPARAWDAGGHMIAAHIAREQLSPATRAKVDALVPLAPDFRQPRRGVKPRPYDFVSLAAWMDDVRDSKKRAALATWHYIDIARGQDPRAAEIQNALDAMDLAAIVLKSDAAPKVKAEWLAIAIHVAGDLHQPLHVAGRERGGNDFLILGAPGIEARVRRDGKSVERGKPATGANIGVYQRLHALWDSGYRVDSVTKNGRQAKVELYDAGYSDKPDTARVASASREIATKYLPERPNITSRVETWISESSDISWEWAFDTPRKGEVSAAYIARLHDTSCTRLALAGFRLARWLEENVK